MEKPEALPEFSIRPATLDDLAALVRIEAAVHVVPWGESSFRAELEKPYSKIWILTDEETDEVVAGYIVFWTLFDECQILNVATDLNFRRKGFAQVLIRKVADFALRQGLKRVVLDVRKSNTPAIQLYQKMYFNVQHVRKSFYSNGEDAYQMVLALSDAPHLEF